MKKWVTFLATLVMMCALASTSYAKDSVKKPTATPAPAAVAVAPKTGCTEHRQCRAGRLCAAQSGKSRVSGFYQISKMAVGL